LQATLFVETLGHNTPEDNQVARHDADYWLTLKKAVTFSGGSVAAWRPKPEKLGPWVMRISMRLFDQSHQVGLLTASNNHALGESEDLFDGSIG